MSTTKSNIQQLEIKRQELAKRKNKFAIFYIMIPFILAGLAFWITKSPFGIVVGGLAAMISYGIYYNNYLGPFGNIVDNVKANLVDDFMAHFHPKVNFSYSPEKRNVYNIITASRLISADKYEEEDVLSGTKNNIKFYLSEIKLKNQTRDKDGKTKTTTIFDGLLFQIRIPNKRFPTAQITSQPSLLKKWFGNSIKNEEYDFWYETEDPQNFENQLGKLFPFIQYLAKKQGDIRIATRNDTITIMLESDMKFMDKPKFKIDRPIINDEYNTTLAKQINSLLFIIDTFGDTLTMEEIEEKLELKMLEYSKIGRE